MAINPPGICAIAREIYSDCQGRQPAPSLRIRKNRAEEALELEILETPGFAHHRLMRRLDQDGRGPPGRSRSSAGCGGETEKAPVARGYSGVILKLEVDLPKASIVADGCEVLAARKGRRVGGFVRCIHRSNTVASRLCSRYKRGLGASIGASVRRNLRRTVVRSFLISCRCRGSNFWPPKRARR